MVNEIRLLSATRSIKSWPAPLAAGALVAFTGAVTLLLLILPARGALAVMALGLGIMGVPVLKAANTEYVVTNLRVVAISGLLSKSQRYVAIPDVLDVKVVRTGLQEAMGIGNVVLSCRSGEFPLEGVEEPQRICDKILSLR